MTAVERLQVLGRTPCAFRCIRAGEHNTPPSEQFIAHVVHRLNRPANAMELWELRSSLGSYAAEAAAVYARHNGFVLYQDLASEAAGVEVLSIRQWAKASLDVRSWLADFFRDEDPDQILDGVAFAHVPLSGNYFVMPSKGRSAGKIFYTNHEGDYSLFAEGFDVTVYRPAFTRRSVRLGDCLLPTPPSACP